MCCISGVAEQLSHLSAAVRPFLGVARKCLRAQGVGIPLVLLRALCVFFVYLNLTNSTLHRKKRVTGAVSLYIYNSYFHSLAFVCFQLVILYNWCVRLFPWLFMLLKNL